MSSPSILSCMNAQFALRYAKNDTKPAAIAALSAQSSDSSLEKSELTVVKGLGKNAIAKLHSAGIRTVYDLRNADSESWKKFLNPVGRKQVSDWLESNPA